MADEAVARVHAGDLITAEFMNALLDRLDRIEDRIKDLEAEAPTDEKVRIIRLEPSDTVRSESQLTIVGRGFGVFGENVVTIGGSRTAPLSGTDEKLVVKVPFFDKLPEDGAEMRLIVSNPRGFARVNMTVLPPAESNIPRGSLVVTRTGGETGKINPGDTPEFVFTVDVQTTLDEKFTVTPVLTADTLGDKWVAKAFDENGREITELSIPKTLAPAITTRKVSVMVAVPPGSEDTTAVLELKVGSRRNSDLKDSDTVEIPVGHAVQAPAQIGLTATVFNGTMSADGTTATMKAGKTTMRLTYVATVPQTASADRTYKVTLSAAPPNWELIPQGSMTALKATDRKIQFIVDAKKLANAALATFNVRIADERDANVFGTKDQTIAP